VVEINLNLIIRGRNKILREFLFPKLYKRISGIKVMEEYWNYLIVLDACRYDYFEREVKRRAILQKFDAKLKKVTSLGSDTPSWMERNFLVSDKKFEDVIYISANPVSYIKNIRNIFFKVIEVWKTKWSKKYQTVLPVKVYKSFRFYSKLYPKKRFIIHFIQPHYPYLCYKPIYGALEMIKDLHIYKKKVNIRLGSKNPFKVYLESPMSYYSDKEIKFGYQYNLEVVMDWVEKLLYELKGRIVVTADHGELLGERILGMKFYGHSHLVRHETLIKVPWMVVENG